jgi:hypothetical protein
MIAGFILFALLLVVLIAIGIFAVSRRPSESHGVRGIRGRRGDTGATGSAGPTGAGSGGSGGTGPTGANGATGANGSAGASGATGPMGSTGVSGAQQGFVGAIQIGSTGGTLTNAQSGNVVFVTPDPTVGATITLPDINGSLGTTYDIVLAGTSASTVVVNVSISGGSYIGSISLPSGLIVASGAVSVVFFSGLQTIGDYAQVISNGVNWQLTAVGQQAGSITAV